MLTRPTGFLLPDRAVGAHLSPAAQWYAAATRGLPTAADDAATA